MNFVYDDEEDNYDTELAHTAVIGFDVVGPLGAYVEYLGVASTDSDTDYQAIFSCGLTLGLTEDLVLDLGSQIGFTSAAADVNVFAELPI